MCFLSPALSRSALACAGRSCDSSLRGRFCQHLLRPGRNHSQHTLLQGLKCAGLTAQGKLYSMASTLQSPAFTEAVVDSMRALYPEELADRSWDNVGLLQENIDPSHHLSPFSGKQTSSTVLLTNDLTLRVAEEAIRKQASVVVTYHPFIFRGLKSITLEDPQQRISLLLAQNNIAVYSPHTAVDAAPEGLNYWLAKIAAEAAKPDCITSVFSVVQPIKTPVPEGFQGSGYGRLVEFDEPVDFQAILKSYGRLLGGLGYAMIARPESVSKEGQKHLVRSVAVCAGSGYDVLKGAKADVIVTGEMSHHNALRAKMLGQAVITFFHSNTERQFLKDSMQPNLQRELEAKGHRDAQVLVSEEDADPFEIVDLRPAAGEK